MLLCRCDSQAVNREKRNCNAEEHKQHEFNSSHLTGSGEMRVLDGRHRDIVVPGQLGRQVVWCPPVNVTCYILHYCVILVKDLNKIMCCIKHVKLMYLELGLPM